MNHLIIDDLSFCEERSFQTQSTDIEGSASFFDMDFDIDFDSVFDNAGASAAGFALAFGVAIGEKIAIVEALSGVLGINS